MIFWMCVALFIEANLIMWCHFGSNPPSENKQSFYPHIELTGFSGEISDFDISKNEYILVVPVYDELIDVRVHSKYNRFYNKGELVKIIDYSDGLYFID